MLMMVMMVVMVIRTAAAAAADASMLPASWPLHPISIGHQLPVCSFLLLFTSSFHFFSQLLPLCHVHWWLMAVVLVAVMLLASQTVCLLQKRAAG